VRVRSLTCPYCGGRTRLDHGVSEAACIHCGQTVKLSNAMLEEQAGGKLYPPTTPLRLGMKAQYRGQEYELTGRMVVRQSEGGETWQWEEFTLVAPDGDLLYLEFDDNRWKVSEPFIPTSPLDSLELGRLSAGNLISLENKTALVSDTGVYQVVFAEGEFPYIVVPDRSVRFVDAEHLGTFYSIGWTEDEIEYYRGDMLGEEQVASMFGDREWIQRVGTRELAIVSRRRFGGLCLGLGMISMVFWIAALVSGRPIQGATGTVPLSVAAGTEGTRFGPFPLKSAGRVHVLEVNGQLHEQSSWVQAILEDEEELELIAADRDMWDESGYDDGHWHESDLHGSTHFLVTKPGNYYVRMYTEPEGIPGGGQASFLLKENVLAPLWPGLYSLLAGIMGIIFLITGSPQTVANIKQSMQASDDDD
jgi:hypothetical protein